MLAALFETSNIVFCAFFSAQLSSLFNLRPRSHPRIRTNPRPDVGTLMEEWHVDPYNYEPFFEFLSSIPVELFAEFDIVVPSDNIKPYGPDLVHLNPTIYWHEEFPIDNGRILTIDPSQFGQLSTGSSLLYWVCLFNSARISFRK